MGCDMASEPTRMTDEEIEQFWHDTYERGYMALPAHQRNELADRLIAGLSVRPHMAFARAIEAATEKRVRREIAADIRGLSNEPLFERIAAAIESGERNE